MALLSVEFYYRLLRPVTAKLIRDFNGSCLPLSESPSKICPKFLSPAIKHKYFPWKILYPICQNFKVC